MPQSRNPDLAAVARFNAAAPATFDQGSAARGNGERYLRDTVLFATVLFVVAIAQRFKVRAVRVTTTAVALGPGRLHDGGHAGPAEGLAAWQPASSCPRPPTSPAGTRRC